jgi:hypothetical protein
MPVKLKLLTEQKNKNVQKWDRPKMPIMQKGSRKRRTLLTQMWKIELHQKFDYWRNIYATQYVQYWIPKFQELSNPEKIQLILDIITIAKRWKLPPASVVIAERLTRRLLNQMH